MAHTGPIPRKRRTRQHVIADQSINYVERFIVDEGHTVQRLEKDYGYDLMMFTYDEQGYVEPGIALLQIKASDTLEQVGEHYVFDVDIRDYHLWMIENNPVFLILFDASRRRAYWLYVQDYFQQDSSRVPRKGAKTVRIHVPKRQAINHRAIGQIRDAKQTIAIAARWGRNS